MSPATNITVCYCNSPIVHVSVFFEQANQWFAVSPFPFQTNFLLSMADVVIPIVQANFAFLFAQEKLKKSRYFEAFPHFRKSPLFGKGLPSQL
jgi:hypothetical protein